MFCAIILRKKIFTGHIHPLLTLIYSYFNICEVIELQLTNSSQNHILMKK